MGENKPYNLFAVEVRKFCMCHRLILARRNEARAWFYFFTKEPCWIEFGDHLLYYPVTRELFQKRGPTLTYRAQLDLIPETVALDLVESLPYAEMYGGSNGGFINIPPQG